MLSVLKPLRDHSPRISSDPVGSVRNRHARQACHPDRDADIFSGRRQYSRAGDNRHGNTSKAAKGVSNALSEPLRPWWSRAPIKDGLKDFEKHD
jgi:hypothetical protein